MDEYRNKFPGSVTLFVETHSLGKSFSLAIGEQNALSRNFIAIIIKDVHLNPLRSHWFYNTQQTSLQGNTIFMRAIYARIEIIKLNDHIELSFIWWAPTYVKAGLFFRVELRKMVHSQWTFLITHFFTLSAILHLKDWQAICDEMLNSYWHCYSDRRAH